MDNAPRSLEGIVLLYAKMAIGEGNDPRVRAGQLQRV